MKLREKTNIDIYEENNINGLLLSNTVEEESTKNKIRATMQIISKTLCGTLGPYGSTTIIQDREMKHFATKDGYDLMNRMSFDDEVSRTILDLLRQVASNQVLSVGDGSTSAIVVANALYSTLTDKNNAEFFKKVAAKDIVDIINDLGAVVEIELKKIAKPVSPDLKEIETVAMISTNNDDAAGRLIKEIYDKIGQYGFITTEVVNKKEVDGYEIKQGLEWGRGFIDPIYARSYENKKIIYDQEPRFFITNSTLTYEDLQILLSGIIGEVCGKQKSELVIVANDYDDDVRKFLKINKTKHLQGGNIPELIFTPVDIDQITKTGRNNLEDLATLVGCEVYDKFEHTPTMFVVDPSRFIGRAEKAIITEKNTQVIGKDLSEDHVKAKKSKVDALNEKIKELDMIEEPSREELIELYELRRRVSSLTDSTAIIHVGGKTQTERITRERLFEDAIFAAKSAIKYGVIVGGNISIPRIINKSKLSIVKKLSKKYSYLPVDDVPEFIGAFLDIIKNSFLESYRNVLNNSYLTDVEVEGIMSKCVRDNKFYNLKLHKFEDSNKTNVINSVNTDLEIMRSCFSIIGILATSNQFLTINFNVRDSIKKEKV
jgi:chaperonin GroEL